MAGKIVGNAIVKGNATSGVSIAEIIGLINLYGLTLGCEPALISKRYQKNSAVSLDAGGGDPEDQYAGDSIAVEAWTIPSILSITVDAQVTVYRSPGNSTGDPGACGCFIVFGDYAGDGPILTGTQAFADGTTGQTDVIGVTPIGNHSFVSCQYTYELPENEALTVWGIAHAYTSFYALLNPISGFVDINILRTAKA